MDILLIAGHVKEVEREIDHRFSECEGKMACPENTAILKRQISRHIDPGIGEKRVAHDIGQLHFTQSRCPRVGDGVTHRGGVEDGSAILNRRRGQGIGHRAFMDIEHAIAIAIDVGRVIHAITVGVDQHTLKGGGGQAGGLDRAGLALQHPVAAKG